VQSDPRSDFGTIRVLLADDDKRYAAALRVLIEEQPELTVVAWPTTVSRRSSSPTNWARTPSSSTCTCRTWTACTADP
jgi:hypothetical protein